MGDEYQSSTNYPLVQITNNSTKDPYARTHDHSYNRFCWLRPSKNSPPISSPVGPGNRAQARLVVVANGIPSSPVS